MSQAQLTNKSAAISKVAQVAAGDMYRFQKHQEDLSVHPASIIPQIGGDTNVPTNQQSQDKKLRVLDRMARLVVDQKPDESSIFSYHYEYKDHLEYYGFMDPERARRQEEFEKRKQAKLLEQQLDKSNKLATTV